MVAGLPEMGVQAKADADAEPYPDADISVPHHLFHESQKRLPDS